MGEGPSGTDVLIHHIDNPTGGYYYRVVDGALIALDPMTPHTGLFACMNKWSQSGSGAVYCVELDPNLPPSEQIEAIVAAVVASDNGPVAVEAAFLRPRGAGSRRCSCSRPRVVEGELVEFDPSQEPHTHHFVQTKSGDYIELDPSAPASEQVETIAALVGGFDQLDVGQLEMVVKLASGWTLITDAYGSEWMRASGAVGDAWVRVVAAGYPPYGQPPGYFRVVSGELVAVDGPDPRIWLCTNENR